MAPDWKFDPVITIFALPASSVVGLIEEIVGENNKKRVYIPDKIKELLLKKGKVRTKKKDKKGEEYY